MGFSKVVKLGPGKVKLVHQLGADGKPYAEDITVESEVPGRLDWLEQQDGEIGTANVSFTAYDPQPEGVQFPDA